MKRRYQGNCWKFMKTGSSVGMPSLNRLLYFAIVPICFNFCRALVSLTHCAAVMDVASRRWRSCTLALPLLGRQWCALPSGGWRECGGTSTTTSAGRLLALHLTRHWKHSARSSLLVAWASAILALAWFRRRWAVAQRWTSSRRSASRIPGMLPYQASHASSALAWSCTGHVRRTLASRTSGSQSSDSMKRMASWHELLTRVYPYAAAFPWAATLRPPPEPTTTPAVIDGCTPPCG
mmetsp:Transcript_31060/g.93958  ORF Transcript_31060/g.93958 Transcript_31060/m.93958 type:complete len:236 (-) Transcript_31060:1134-1841(-)